MAGCIACDKLGEAPRGACPSRKAKACASRPPEKRGGTPGLQVYLFRTSALRKSMTHTTMTIPRMAVPALEYRSRLICWLR